MAVARRDSPHATTPAKVREAMLQLARLEEREYVIDLGCGNGTLLIHAAKRYGIRGLGVDLDRDLVDEAIAEAERQGVSNLVKFRVEDMFKTEVRSADVVLMYLLTDAVNKLAPKLFETMREGARILTHDYHLNNVYPSEQVFLNDHDKVAITGQMFSSVYKYVLEPRAKSKQKHQLEKPMCEEHEIGASHCETDSTEHAETQCNIDEEFNFRWVSDESHTHRIIRRHVDPMNLVTGYIAVSATNNTINEARVLVDGERRKLPDFVLTIYNESEEVLARTQWTSDEVSKEAAFKLAPTFRTTFGVPLTVFVRVEVRKRQQTQVDEL